MQGQTKYFQERHSDAQSVAAGERRTIRRNIIGGLIVFGIILAIVVAVVFTAVVG